MEQVRHFCRNCGCETHHTVVQKHVESGPEDYHCQIDHMIVRCNGCDLVSFRYVFSDYERAYPISDQDWEVPQDIKRYPASLANHSALDGLEHAPELVRKVYDESLTCLTEGAYILAGLGLRATIEAICNDRGITGRTLEKRIGKLASAGLISTNDANRLHAIRFLGNDAAHEVKCPNISSLQVALRIVEHLIATVYILDKEADGKLDTIVYDYQGFKTLLESHLGGYKPRDEYPLAMFLGKDVRRLPTQLSAMEVKLIAEIASGEYKRLRKGKLAVYNNSPTPLQHFVVL